MDAQCGYNLGILGRAAGEVALAGNRFSGGRGRFHAQIQERKPRLHYSLRLATAKERQAP